MFPRLSSIRLMALVALPMLPQQAAADFYALVDPFPANSSWMLYDLLELNSKGETVALLADNVSFGSQDEEPLEGSLRCGSTFCVFSTLGGSIEASTVYNLTFSGLPLYNQSSSATVMDVDRATLDSTPGLTFGSNVAVVDKRQLTSATGTWSYAWNVTLSGMVAPSIEWDSAASTVVVMAAGLAGAYMITLDSTGFELSRVRILNGDMLHMGGTAICPQHRVITTYGGKPGVPVAAGAESAPTGGGSGVWYAKSGSWMDDDGWDEGSDPVECDAGSESADSSTAPADINLAHPSLRGGVAPAVAAIGRRLRGAGTPAQSAVCKLHLGRGSNYSLNSWSVDTGALVGSITVRAAEGVQAPHAIMPDCGLIGGKPRWLGFMSQMEVGPPAVIEYRADGDLRAVAAGTSLPRGLQADFVAAFHEASRAVLVSYFQGERYDPASAAGPAWSGRRLRRHASTL